ncbi:BMP family ABC transporter substrate-binding protein [Faecalicatena acetigenes]|uniref:BMP family ABC transporter substrate-binding protein n=1 Tax=Faecalicatena acetigenes TaxID=2981790 RepID=A0ABT2T7P6_9FIRM|nr:MULTISPECIES: BMP family ABC transporter substrate-binding protein [Lachnospiraceae]MCU6746295.1 BMP family ABC transporter substrate-binding protein [Faecalicatena acetigenes]SCH06014.1 Purine-binding protein BAB2_0673 precursor [uncultured Clostridium sp.]
MKKKVLSAVLSAVMVIGMLAGCGAPAAESGGSDDAKKTEKSEGIAKEDIKVGFVHISDPSDMGYTYNHDLGTQEMQKELGLSDEQIVNKYNVPEGAECDTALRELVDAGCNIIFATSFGYEDYVKEVAAEYPDIEFCHATGLQAKEAGLDNFHNYFASIYEGRYLAGIAAGMKTESNKLGYVAAFPFAEVISGYTAFYLGAKSVNPDVTMDIMYTNSWNDPTVESQVAKALIERGCDVVSQHSDSTAPATTAEENGVWQVGYNNDMIEAAPDASLISPRIDWGIYVTEAVQAVIDGKEIPLDWCKGYKDGAVYLSPLNEKIAAEGTQEAIDKAAAAIESGELHVFAGPLKGVTPDGEEYEVKEGEYYHEQEEQSAPSWLYIIDGCNVVE